MSKHWRSSPLLCLPIVPRGGKRWWSETNAEKNNITSFLMNIFLRYTIIRYTCTCNCI
jgi:hypothetical protein